MFNMKFFIGINVFLFGLCASLEAATFNFSSLAACRWFLGHFEALFGPVVVYYLTLFYTKKEIAMRISIWFGIAAIAGAFSGAIAYGVQTIEQPAIKHWQILFLIEGLPACVCGLLTMVLTPDRPNSSSMWFSEQERSLIITRVGKPDATGSVNRKHVISALIDWKVYWAGAIYFCLNNALSSTSVYLPAIVKSLGYSNASAQLHVVPPYVVAAGVTIGVALLSDYVQLRGPFMVLVTAISVAGYAILIGTNTNEAKYAGVFLVVMGVYPSIAMINGWLVGTNLGSETKKAAGMGLFYAIGQCGSILGSKIFPDSDDYVKGYAISLALMGLACLMCALLTLYYYQENKRRDRLYGEADPDKILDLSEEADKHPAFRYLL
ncbi:MFS general substrate transporter [Wallemia mellicola CBS 633.66]|uniref:MFS general substrate transporter n=1 Tax=Wallemia mellicola (strain ATCC MYA-4683 / CBS 633.66) TaxID=671144 RepID=I4YA92_WALMC|nr:MFS general substrate transporter [Wallemia mellicola CBS 633.66]EIM20884.1 MFS general substrate transporter [Wallemia mellicola CBS 633.66]|eukprot:XP_006959143.1 MFS general substrate transporter [Wallemia mellicola CBS 633.66]